VVEGSQNPRHPGCIGISWRSRGCRPSWSPKTFGTSASRISVASERYLTRDGVVIRKFFLHVSNKEQKKRFLERIEEPEKNWQFSANDDKEREYWDAYMEAYEDMIQNTATKRPRVTWCPPTTSGLRALSSLQ
jgi:hypothetical protein